jgi:hypothetical protein
MSEDGQRTWMEWLQAWHVLACVKSCISQMNSFSCTRGSDGHLLHAPKMWAQARTQHLGAGLHSIVIEDAAMTLSAVYGCELLCVCSWTAI